MRVPAALSRRPISETLLRLFMVLYACLIWPALLLATSAGAAPVADKGIIDLSSWSLSTDGVLRLQGEWEFYWQQFIHPDEFAAAAATTPEPPEFMPVPGAWHHAKYGYGTYRLRIVNARTTSPLALHIPYEQTAYRLWINGQQVASNGEIGTDPATTKPEYRPVLARFQPQPGESLGDAATSEPGDVIELVIHVANFDFRLGGLWNSPLLGTEQRLERLLNARNLVTALLSGAFLTVGIYHIAFSIFRRNRDTTRAALALALLSVSIAVRTILMGDRTIALIFPDLPWLWQIRLEYLAGYTAVLAMAIYLAATFPRETPKLVTWVAAASMAVGGGVTLVAPVRISSQITPYVILLNAALIIGFLAVAVRAFLHRREGGTLLLSGGVFFAATALLDFLYYNRVIESINLMPFGFFGLVLAQTFILGQQFANAFHVQNRLLRDLQNSRHLIAQLHERERREVAEFLHSRVQSRLILIGERLKEAVRLIEQQDPKAARAVREVQDEVLEVQQRDIRRASHLLHPSAIEAGLIPAVQDLAATYDGTVEVSVSADDALVALDTQSSLGIPTGGPTISRSLRLCLYRIVEECLGNARKHSGASRIDIAFRLSDNTLRLAVADDGKGFTPNPASTKGLGLKIVDARVREVRGTWEIVPRPGGGTIIHVAVPLDSPDDEHPAV